VQIPMELVYEARKGSQAALERLLKELQPHIHERVNRKVFSTAGRLQTVSDIVQNVNIAIVRDVCNFVGDSEGKFFAWLNTLINNRVIDSGRENNPPTESIDPNRSGGGLELEAPGLRPSTLAQDRELAETLRNALARLPPREADAMRMIFIEERTRVEVAEVLGIEKNNLDQIVFRTVRKLRRLLPDAPFNP